jgi:hypothetical protein
MSTVFWKIRRRQFSHLFVASAIGTAITNLAGRTLAQQQTQMFVYGVRLNAQSSRNLGAIDRVRTVPSLILDQLDLTTGQMHLSQTLPTATVDEAPLLSTTPILTASQPQERITGFIKQPDGTFVISTVVTTDRGNFNRLLLIDRQLSRYRVRAKAVSGLGPTDTIESLLATRSGQLLAISSLNGGVGHFVLAELDPFSGRILQQLKAGPGRLARDIGLPELSTNQRYSNLAQSSNGTVYATTLGKEAGNPILVKIDFSIKKLIPQASLSFNGKPLGNDLLDLGYTSSGQMMALADPTNQGTPSLFTVNEATGKLTFLKRFAVSKIIFDS